MTDRARLAWILVIAVLGGMPLACGQPLPAPVISSVTPHQAYTDGPVFLLVSSARFRPGLDIEVGSGALTTNVGSLRVTLVPETSDDRPRVPLEIVKWDGERTTWVRTPVGLADGPYALELADSGSGKTSLSDAFVALGPDPGPPEIQIKSPLPDAFVGAGTTFSARVVVDDHLGGIRQVDWRTSDGGTGNCPTPVDAFTLSPPSSIDCDVTGQAPGLSDQDPTVTPFSFSVTATDSAGYQAELEIALHLAKLPVIESFSNQMGALGGYQPFFVHGHNFLPGTKALIGGVPIAGSAPGGNVANDQSIVGWTPPHNRAEAVAVDVVSPAGSAQSSPMRFRYALPPRPRDIQPTVGPTHGGILVTVTGNDLGDGVVIYVGRTLESRQPLYASTVDSTHTEVIGCVPPGTGTVSVWAYHPVTGDGLLSKVFTYEEPAPGPDPWPVDPRCQGMPP